VQATSDETMLVRRAGTLQWVPLIAGIVFLPAGDLFLDGVIVLNNHAFVFSGTIL
jgi:hypothetical protein